MKFFINTLFALTYCWPSTLWSFSEEKKNQIDIIYSDPQLFENPDSRKQVYYSARLAKKAFQYKKNPAAFTVLELPPSSVAIEPTPQKRQLSLKEVLDQEALSLNIYLEGSQISQSMALNALSSAASLAGTYGGALNTALDLGGLSLDYLNPAHTPDYSSVNMVGMGDLLEGLKKKILIMPTNS